MRIDSSTAMTPNSEACVDRHLDTAHDAIRALGAHVVEHVRVVHLVDVIAGQNDEELRARRFQDVEILEHRVGGAAIPGRLVEPLLRRQQVEELVHLRAQKRPAHLQVPQQAVRLVLGQHGDPPDVRVEAVRQDEIDDAELAAEEHRRLGAAVGQLLEPAAAAAGEDQRDRAAREAFLIAGRRKHLRSSWSRHPRGAIPPRIINVNAQATTSGRDRPRMPGMSASEAAAAASGASTASGAAACRAGSGSNRSR